MLCMTGPVSLLSVVYARPSVGVAPRQQESEAGGLIRLLNTDALLPNLLINF